MSGLFDQITNYSPPLLTAGQVNYKGTWSAAANTPTLTSPPAATSKGDYYVVSAAGTQFGITFAVGDWIISNGTAWEKVDLTDAVSSVFGRTGAVVSANGDYTASQVTNVPAGTISSTNVQDAINELSTDISTAQNVLDAIVTNADSVTITKGQVVYAFGATGNRMSVKLALNTSDATSAKTVGVVLDSSIGAGNTGNIRMVGVVDGLNLGAYNDGDTLYLGATAGSVTSTKPYAPNHLVYVGIVERANSGNGQLYVRVQNGYELDEIHDVQITSAPASGALLVRDATNSLWKAARLTAGTNIAITNADASVTVGITGEIPFANGGTNSTSAPQALARLNPIASTVTSATPVVLTNTSAAYQIFTGSTAQTVLLPVTSTLETGWQFSLCNNSTGVLTIQTSAGTFLIFGPVGCTIMCKCIATGSTAVTDWEANITEFSTNTGTGAVVLNSNPTFTSFVNNGAAAMAGAATNNHTLGTNLTTGTVIIGGTATTGTLTFGQSTVGNTINIDAGATASGSTKTLNIGTGGLTGSTTAIAIGSTAGTSTLTLNGVTNGAFNGTVGATTASTGAFTTLNATSNITSTATNPYFVGSSATAGTIYYGSTGAASSVQTLVNNTQITTVSSTGLAVTGGLSTTGSVTATAGFVIGNDNSFLYDSGTGAVTLRLGASGPYGSFLTNSGDFMVDGAGGTLLLGAAGTRVATITSTGLAVTGALSTTGNVTLGGGADFFNGSVRISDSASSTAPAYFQSGEPGISGSNVIVSNNYYGSSGGASGRKNTSVGASYLRLNVGAASTSTATLGVISASGTGTDVASFSSTGLAVTGDASATAQVVSGVVGATGSAWFRAGSTLAVKSGIDISDSSDTSGAVFAAWRNGSGSVIASIARVTTTNAVVYNTTSDSRLKENLRDFTDSGRLIDSLKPRVFDWKNSDENGKNVIGFIAQEEHAADSIFAHIGAVSVGDEDPDTITKQWQRSDSALIPILVAELKSLRQRVAALESN